VSPAKLELMNIARMTDDIKRELRMADWINARLVTAYATGKITQVMIDDHEGALDYFKKRLAQRACEFASSEVEFQETPHAEMITRFRQWDPEVFREFTASCGFLKKSKEEYSDRSCSDDA